MSETVVPYVVGIWIACGILEVVIGSQKKAAGAGYFLGIAFGPLGLIAALALDWRPLCPRCKARLNGQATLCPYCKLEIAWIAGNYDVTPVPADQAEAIKQKASEHLEPGDDWVDAPAPPVLPAPPKQPAKNPMPPRRG
jgi:hypothetical protein